MFKQLKQDENGIVYVTILMIITVMITVTIGIISLNVSQTTFTESEVRRIKAELLSMGALAYVYANQMTASASSSMTLPSESLDGFSYATNALVSGTGSGPNGADPLLIQVDY